MLPEHANPYGNVHGGVLLKMIDEAGAIAAMRHAHRPCVTVAVDSMEFHSPVHVGELITCSAHVSWVGTSSMELEIEVHAENPMTGRLTHTNSAYVVYVAIDAAGQPTQVPPLLLETAEDQLRWETARERQAHRVRTRQRTLTPSRR
jgi:uncharacterized protein (TIGR00369 family)